MRSLRSHTADRRSQAFFRKFHFLKNVRALFLRNYLIIYFLFGFSIVIFSSELIVFCVVDKRSIEIRIVLMLTKVVSFAFSTVILYRTTASLPYPPLPPRSETHRKELERRFWRNLFRTHR